MKYKLIITTAATALLFTACKNPADSSTEASVSKAKDVSTEAIRGTKWVFTEDSTINFIGSKVTGSHEGGFKKFNGHFYVDENSLAPSGHQIIIDMASTYSDAEKLTGHLLSADFFDVATYPTSTFTVTGIEEQPGAKGQTHALTGNFDFHGVTKSITIPVVVSSSEKEINVTADFFINRFDFNIKYPGKTDDLIRNEVVIKFDLKATPATSEQ